MRVKEESENSSIELNIQKMNIMTTDPITSWQIDGKKVKTVADFIFLGSKIIEDSDCSNEIHKHLLLGRKAMTNIDRLFTKAEMSLCPQRSMVSKVILFPVQM